MASLCYHVGIYGTGIHLSQKWEFLVYYSYGAYQECMKEHIKLLNGYSLKHTK